MLEERTVVGGGPGGADGDGDDAQTNTVPTNTVLYFGCRHQNKDFLYGPQFQGAVQATALTALHTAFSRDQEKKIYVQVGVLARMFTYCYPNVFIYCYPAASTKGESRPALGRYLAGEP
jgi:hypothetical protein